MRGLLNMAPRFNDPGPKYPSPSFDGPSDFMAPVKRNDRRRRAQPVSVERRICLRRRDDRIAAGKGA